MFSSLPNTTQRGLPHSPPRHGGQLKVGAVSRLDKPDILFTGDYAFKPLDDLLQSRPLVAFSPTGCTSLQGEIDGADGKVQIHQEAEVVDGWLALA